MRKKATIHNILDEKPMISFDAITEKMKPNTLNLKGNLKGKYITTL
jgi:hypothetical protein